MTKSILIAVMCAASMAVCLNEPMYKVVAVKRVVQDNAQQMMAAQIVQKYKVDPNLAIQVVAAAHKYQRDDFPKAKDIVAIVGIESSFNPNSKSKLKRDPAIGLTQIRPGTWKHAIDRQELMSIDGQIKHGVAILAHNYDVLGDKVQAVKAYNIGLTAQLHGRYQAAAVRYATKYNNEVIAYR